MIYKRLLSKYDYEVNGPNIAKIMKQKDFVDKNFTRQSEIVKKYFLVKIYELLSKDIALHSKSENTRQVVI